MDAGWPFNAHPMQLPDDLPWIIWLIMAGRGAGKTRAGAEWVRALVHGLSGYAEAPVGRIALVGETFADARDVMVEGPSGLLAVHPRAERPTWTPSVRKLEWPNGAVAHVFSSEDPDSLRGPQFEAAWADELAKWRHAEEAWDMLQFGLRLGSRPREIVTTTPRPIPLLKRLLADTKVSVSRMATAENAQHLAPAFLDAVVGRYAGTRLGRQELDGALIEERPDALWTRDAVDSGGTAYMLADATASGLKPPEWAAKAVALYRRFEADALVVETNQGGEMAGAVLREVDGSVPVTAVRATRGKYLRAEPVSVLYAQGRVRHVGAFPELEDEMCDFGPGGLSSGRSPDRLDALVWALTHLMLTGRGEPRVRVL
jgi:phage terminase large subunit-like protein